MALQEDIEDNIAKYIDEWIQPQIEFLIEEKMADIAKDNMILCEEIKAELVYEMYKMKKELEEQFNLKSKRPFWKWWK